MAVFIGVSCVSCASGVVGTGVMETGLPLAFFLALVAGGCSVMCAGMGAVTDLGINTADVVAFAGAGSISFAGEADVDLSSAFFGDFFFFAGDFNPIVSFLRLVLAWLLFKCSLADGGCGNCCCCGFCGDCGNCSSRSFWWILLGAKLRYMPLARSFRLESVGNVQRLEPLGTYLRGKYCSRADKDVASTWFTNVN